MVNDVCASLEAGKTKDSDLTHRMSVRFARELHAKFVLAFEESVSKVKAYTNMDTGYPVNKLWKAERIFGPRQVPSLSKNIVDFAPHINGINANDAKILEKWVICLSESTSTPLADDFKVVA